MNEQEQIIGDYYAERYGNLSTTLPTKTSSTNQWTGWKPNTEQPSNIESNFQSQQTEQFELFKVKNRNYGMNNVSGGMNLDVPEYKKEALQGLYFRMRDKLMRFKQLIENSSEGTNDESLEDTLNDLSNYANISLIVNKGQWK